MYVAGKAESTPPKVKNITIHPLSALDIIIGEFGAINLGKFGEGHPIPIAAPNPIKLAVESIVS